MSWWCTTRRLQAAYSRETGRCSSELGVARFGLSTQDKFDPAESEVELELSVKGTTANRPRNC